jgi:hypothetical protein
MTEAWNNPEADFYGGFRVLYTPWLRPGQVVIVGEEMGGRRIMIGSFVTDTPLTRRERFWGWCDRARCWVFAHLRR